jgi:hypothetical protein
MLTLGCEQLRHALLTNKKHKTCIFFQNILNSYWPRGIEPELRIWRERATQKVEELEQHRRDIASVVATAEDDIMYMWKLHCDMGHQIEIWSVLIILSYCLCFFSLTETALNTLGKNRITQDGTVCGLHLGFALLFF